MSESTGFRPAVPSRLVLWAVQTYLRLDLAWRNRLHVEPCDIKRLRDLPQRRVLSSPPTTPMRRTSRLAWNSHAAAIAGSSI